MYVIRKAAIHQPLFARAKGQTEGGFLRKSSVDLHLSSLAVLTLLLLGAPEINLSSCEEETRLIWEGITRGSSLQREGLEPLTQACSRLSLSAAKPKLLSPGTTENSAKEQSSDFSLCLQPGEESLCLPEKSIHSQAGAQLLF